MVGKGAIALVWCGLLLGLGWPGVQAQTLDELRKKKESAAEEIRSAGGAATVVAGDDQARALATHIPQRHAGLLEANRKALRRGAELAAVGVNG